MIQVIYHLNQCKFSLIDKICRIIFKRLSGFFRIKVFSGDVASHDYFAVYLFHINRDKVSLDYFAVYLFHINRDEFSLYYFFVYLFHINRDEFSLDYFTVYLFHNKRDKVSLDYFAVYLFHINVMSSLSINLTTICGILIVISPIL